jgi:CNT family concentrative nucleoside transporter
MLPRLSLAPVHEYLAAHPRHGAMFAPLTWLMGVPLAETLTAGALLGTKTVVTEFVAIANMTQLPAGSLSPGAALAMSYALISFANFATAGIMSAALYAIAPERRH